MTDAIVFSWSGSFRDDEERQEGIAAFIEAMHDRGVEVGLVAGADRGDIEDVVPEMDFAVGNVEDIRAVLRSLTTKYDKLFFVSDVPAELAAVNRSGAFTAGFTAGAADTDDLSGVGPNYLVDSLDELRQILLLEME